MLASVVLSESKYNYIRSFLYVNMFRKCEMSRSDTFRYLVLSRLVIQR